MTDRRPRHEILKHLLLDHLATAGVGVGARFPSQNELMKRYGLSHATVTRALNGMEADGWLSREQGRGTFVRAVPTSADLARTRPQRTVVVLCAADPLKFGAGDGSDASDAFTAALEDALPQGWKTVRDTYPAADADLARYEIARPNLDALVCRAPTSGQASMSRRLAACLPVVLAGDDPGPAPGLGRVCHDPGEAGRMVAEHLLQAGHRNIALIEGGSGGGAASDALSEGYKAALAGAGVAFRESLSMVAAGGDGHGALLDLFDRNSETVITAVIAADAALAAGVLSAARSMGLAVPGDLSVAVAADSADAASATPPLTTAGAPPKAMAMAVADMLGAMTEGVGAFGRVEIGAVLTVRGSTGPARGK